MSERYPGDPQDRAAALAALAERLRQMRLDRGWSQAQLAKRARINRNVVNTTEHGRSYPNADNLGRMAAALGVPVEDLTGRSVASLRALPAAVRACALETAREPGYSWVQVNRLVRTATALAVMRLLVEDEPPTPTR